MIGGGGYRGDKEEREWKWRERRKKREEGKRIVEEGRGGTTREEEIR